MRIDNQEISFKQGMSVLEAARQAGIPIPTLCHHEGLEPFGGCRLCLVEVEERGWARLVVACVFPADDKLIVRTRSEKIDRLRKTILELLLAHAPHSPELLALGREYGANPSRFQQDPSFCIQCGLCVRYCNEVKQLDAVGFIDRGIAKQIAFVPDIARAACAGCKECFPLCPTSYLQAAFVLLEAQTGERPCAE